MAKSQSVWVKRSHPPCRCVVGVSRRLQFATWTNTKPRKQTWSNPSGTLTEQPYGRPASSATPLKRTDRHVSGMTATTATTDASWSYSIETPTRCTKLPGGRKLPFFHKRLPHTHTARTHKPLDQLKVVPLTIGFSFLVICIFIFCIEILFKLFSLSLSLYILIYNKKTNYYLMPVYINYK